MWWGNGSWGYDWWPVIMLMGVFMVICMVMMARMMGRAWPGPRREPERHGPDAPERILERRLASREIDIDEYERLRDAVWALRQVSKALWACPRVQLASAFDRNSGSSGSLFATPSPARFPT